MLKEEYDKLSSEDKIIARLKGIDKVTHADLIRKTKMEQEVRNVRNWELYNGKTPRIVGF